MLHCAKVTKNFGGSMGHRPVRGDRIMTGWTDPGNSRKFKENQKIQEIRENDI